MESYQSRLSTSRLKIALIGYGKMGKMIEQLALADGHAIVAKIDSANHSQLSQSVENADVCMDFSHPAEVVKNIEQMARLRKNIVVGTTGWDEHLEKIRDIIHQSSIGFLYSPNFSIGVLLFLKLISQAAALFNPFAEYDVSGFEAHHRQKIDAPSGTAKAIADSLLKNFTRKKQIVYNFPQEQKEEVFHMSSLRCGSIPGIHSMIFDSPFDTITLTHSAKGREGFAKGALLAAQWLQGKQGFFTLENLLEDTYG